MLFRSADLATINTPTLVLSGEHDTMDPRFLEHMASLMPNGRSFTCPQGSHMAMYDDPHAYFGALVDFINSLA